MKRSFAYPPNRPPHAPVVYPPWETWRRSPGTPPGGGTPADGPFLFGTSSGGGRTNGIGGITPYPFGTSSGIGSPALSSYTADAGDSIGYYWNSQAVSPNLLFFGIGDYDGAQTQAQLRALSVANTGVAAIAGAVNMLGPDTGTIPAVASTSTGRAYAISFDRTSDLGAYEVIAAEVSGGVLVQIGNTLSGSLGHDVLLVNSADCPAHRAMVLDDHFIVAYPAPGLGSNRAGLVAFAFDGTNFVLANALQPVQAYSSFYAGNGCFFGWRTDGPVIDVFTYTATGGFVLEFSYSLPSLDATSTLTECYNLILDPVHNRLHAALFNSSYTSWASFVGLINLTNSTVDFSARIDGLSEERVYTAFAYDDFVITNVDGWDGAMAMRFDGSTYLPLSGTFTERPAEWFPIPLLSAP